MNRYTVQVNGMTTTLRLSDEDAAARGLTPDPAPALVKAAKAVTTKAKRPANKARTTSNKRAEIAALAFGPQDDA